MTQGHWGPKLNGYLKNRFNVPRASRLSSIPIILFFCIKK